MSRINKKLDQEGVAFWELCERKKNLNNAIVISFVIDVVGEELDTIKLAFGIAIKSMDDIYKPRVAKAVAYNRLKNTPCYTTIEKDVYSFFKGFGKGEQFLLLKCLEQIVVEDYNQNLDKYNIKYPHLTKKIKGKTLQNAIKLCCHVGEDIIDDLETVYEFSLDDLETGGGCWLN